jgi:hypothetical protein
MLMLLRGEEQFVTGPTVDRGVVRTSGHRRSADPMGHQSLSGHFSVGVVPKAHATSSARRFLADLYADWVENGLAVIQEVRETCPDVYLGIPEKFEGEKDEAAH